MPSRSHKSRTPSLRRKARKTFLLSRDAVDFLESERSKRGGESASLVLEEIIHECRKRQDTKNVDAKISAYYDSLSNEEREEDKRWGEFAESQFPVD